MIRTSLSLKPDQCLSLFRNGMRKFKEDHLFSDATLACEGYFYSVHKLILSMSSDYFGAIFEAVPSGNTVIVLSDIKRRHLETLLEFIYLGEVTVENSELPYLLRSAEHLKIKGLLGNGRVAHTKNDTAVESDNVGPSKTHHVAGRTKSQAMKGSELADGSSNCGYLELQDSVSVSSVRVNNHLNFDHSKELHKCVDDYPVDIKNEEISVATESHEEFSATSNQVMGDILCPDSGISSSGNLSNVITPEPTVDPLSSDSLVTKDTEPVLKDPTTVAAEDTGALAKSSGRALRHRLLPTIEPKAPPAMALSSPYPCPLCMYESNLKTDVYKHMEKTHKVRLGGCRKRTFIPY